MAAFDDLTEKEAGELVFIVGGARALDAEVFMPLVVIGAPAALRTLDGKGVLTGVPRDEAFWSHLAMSGYLQISSNTIRLLPRAYAYAQYCDRRSWGRFWTDLRYDLAHDATVRSKLLWAAIAVLVGWGLERLTDLLRAL